MARSSESPSASSLSSSHTPPSENTPPATAMPPFTKKVDKKPQMLVVLKLSPAKLGRFSDAVTVPPSVAESNNGSTMNSPRNSSPLAVAPTPQVGSPMGSEATSAQTPAGVPGPAKPGPKRGRQPGVPGAKPGRKKQKLENGASAVMGFPGIGGPHKLGPKANQGAINAQLRALDRTGKPCKRWAKAGFQLKSFTGFQWSIPTWATPSSMEKNLDMQSISPNPATPVANSSSSLNSVSNQLNRPGGTLLDIASNAP
ncbi:INO80 complex subunit Ies4-domain-containing protein [Peziza echinospora]|nr:INO80 complex subunit Ies4-domain-containing protein [Peziza echinospora]